MGHHPHPAPEFPLNRTLQSGWFWLLSYCTCLADRDKSGFSWTFPESLLRRCTQPGPVSLREAAGCATTLALLPPGSAPAWPRHPAFSLGTELPARCPPGFLPLVATCLCGR